MPVILERCLISFSVSMCFRCWSSLSLFVVTSVKVQLHVVAVRQCIAWPLLWYDVSVTFTYCMEMVKRITHFFHFLVPPPF